MLNSFSGSSSSVIASALFWWSPLLILALWSCSGLACGGFIPKKTAIVAVAVTMVSFNCFYFISFLIKLIYLYSVFFSIFINLAFCTFLLFYDNTTRNCNVAGIKSFSRMLNINNAAHWMSGL